MEAWADFSAYIEKTADELLARLASLTSELANAHIMLGTSLQQEKSARVMGFMRSQETTVAAKERDAESQALASYTSVVELKASILALTEERDLLRLLIEDRRARQDRPVDQRDGLEGRDQGPGNPGQ